MPYVLFFVIFCIHYNKHDYYFHRLSTSKVINVFKNSQTKRQIKKKKKKKASVGYCLKLYK